MSRPPASLTLAAGSRPLRHEDFVGPGLDFRMLEQYAARLEADAVEESDPVAAREQPFDVPVVLAGRSLGPRSG